MTVFIIFIGLFVAVASIALSILLAHFLLLAILKVPYAPTPRPIIEQLLTTLNIKCGITVYDIGCGDGRFLIAAAQRGATAKGFEAAPLPYCKARLAIWRSNLSNIQLYYGNAFKAQLNDADIIFCFMTHRVMPLLEEKIHSLTKPCIVVTYGFALPTLVPYQIVTPNPANTRSSKLFFYRHSPTSSIDPAAKSM